MRSIKKLGGVSPSSRSQKHLCYHFFNVTFFIYYRMLLQSGAQSIKHAGRYFEKFIKVAHAKNATGRHKNLLPANLHSMPEMKPIKAISKKNWNSRLFVLSICIDKLIQKLIRETENIQSQMRWKQNMFFQKPRYVRWYSLLLVLF